MNFYPGGIMKKKSILIAIVIALLAIFVVAAVSTVFVNDSKERYANVSSNKSDDAVAPASVKDESTQPLAQNEVGGVNETVTEHMEDANEAVPETVVDEGAIAEPDTTEEATAPVEQDQAEAAPAEQEQASAEAKTHIVTAVGLKYEPLVIQIQPGDKVAWENMPTHDTQSLEGLIPEGAEAWHSQMGENYQRTFTVEGIYVYKCTPHFGAGMGGAIIVGNPVNLDQIKAADAKGAAARLVKKAIAAAEKM
ncbi:MAG TPA: copper-binding protein [Methylophaga aminisulfidivorans]|jgi:pseudoazurin|nr:copper-binding protein [Methylophaga sp.]HIM38933.1 copper-binding protein [Methylophaga aminisulfidivorans]